MRRLIGRILAWFLRDYLVAQDAIVISRDEYVQIQKASFENGLWRAQVRIFTKEGTILKTVYVQDLNKLAIREAANGN